MINITTTLFTFLLLVTQNIILLNEETLILLCFISFIILSLNNLHISANSFFKNQTLQIETPLKTSLKNILNFSQKFTTLKTSLKNISQKFTTLKTYYLGLTTFLASFSFSYNKLFLTSSHKKRLIFLAKVENQTTKLLVAVLLKKLTSISKTKKFYKSVVKSPHFLCLDAILLRECINSIDIKK